MVDLTNELSSLKGTRLTGLCMGKESLRLMQGLVSYCRLTDRDAHAPRNLQDLRGACVGDVH